ncbi:uncharacterized protein Z518_01590 [Rhinocladiella mackenziei CBS 650.93]|uniref:Oxidoreductase n=1 Tax=Rhinocladiella mackenziei CBS 650.93 TaxID=1442369 RepID=A0A0D2G6D3_9EURO|nr:uncharacterized protein Z518_01590 [Rhinocladiella mackenziei CBS 650.93]KIX10507.1 hypothetical protein Z518_01590 [Rhinocladiella mackenziei CBS 650.93]
MESTRVGIIGYGFSAKCFHLPFILSVPEFQVVAFFQRAEKPQDPTSAKPGSHCTVNHPNAKHYQAADEFFADSDIDLVIVCSHTDTHALFAEKALLAGKHVVVEKPFTRTTEEADRIISLAKEKGLILTCYQNRRWDNDFQTLQYLIQHDALGVIKDAQIHYDFENAPWVARMTKKEYSPGEGMSFGLGYHSLDQALLLFGRPKSVTAFLRAVRGIESEIEDTFTIILQYDGPQRELLVTIKTAIITVMQDQLKFFIRGTKGSYVKYGTCIQESQIFTGLKPTTANFGVEDSRLHGTLTTTTCFDKTQTYEPTSEKYIGAYPTIPGRWMEFYANLADAICGRAEIAVKPEQSRDGIRVIELARLSHEQGRSVPWS